MSAAGEFTSRRVARNRFRQRREFAEFSSLIATPFVFGNTAAGATSPNTLSLPGNIRLVGSVDAILAQADVTLNLNTGLAPQNPATAAADVEFDLRFGWKNDQITVSRDAGAPSGAFTLSAVDLGGRRHVIGTCVFTV